MLLHIFINVLHYVTEVQLLNSIHHVMGLNFFFHSTMSLNETKTWKILNPHETFYGLTLSHTNLFPEKHYFLIPLKYFGH